MELGPNPVPKDGKFPLLFFWTLPLVTPPLTMNVQSVVSDSGTVIGKILNLPTLEEKIEPSRATYV